MDFSADDRGKMWRCQNTIEGGRREAGVLVLAFEDGPSGASRKPDGLRLLIKRTKSGSDKSLADFPDLGRLSRLHFCCGVRAAVEAKVLAVFASVESE